MATTPTIDGWAVLELMGHRRLAGKLTEVLVGGTTLLRIDVPRVDGSTATQLYGVGSVYCITPTTEEIAFAVAIANPPEPIHPWELRPRLAAAPPATDTEFVEEAGAGFEHDDGSDVHAFSQDEDEQEAICAECGGPPSHPDHAHVFVQAEIGGEDACALGCGAGPDDQVHVVDEHPYEPESESGDPCGHCGRSGHDPIHPRIDPTKEHHVFEEGNEPGRDRCLHCDRPEADPLHVDVGGTE